MRISVALAVRNAEPFLGALLDSLARQTEPPCELVVHDDASADATPQILDRFARSAPFPVAAERGERRRGASDAFLAAARRCSGDAIAFCDQDDVWLERKLEVCGGELARSGAVLAMHSARVVDAELRDTGRVWPAIEASRLVPPLGLSGLAVDAPGMAMVFRRELLESVPFEDRPPSRYGDGRMLHDEWVLFVAGVLGAVSLVADPLVLYRQHAGNHSGGWVDRGRRLSLWPAVDDYRRAEEHTAACAEYLERAAAGRPALLAGARAYRRAAGNWALRRALYARRGRRERVRVLRQLVVADAYGDRTGGGFGRAALGKDLLAGVALRAGARSDGG